MLLFPPANFRKPPRHVEPAPLPPGPPQTLTLVSAAYDEIGLTLALTFDRPVDAADFDAAQVSVNDGSFNMALYGGVGPAGVLAPTQISVALARLADAPLAPVTMSASALTGITAVDDGGTWAGVNGVGLPFDG